jgi:intracellular sulfur oxidation DsrE/DsrF family protein
MLKKISSLLFIALAIIAPIANAQTPASTKNHHVIFVVTSADPDDWNTAMILTLHFLQGIKPEPAEVEVLAYGAGIPIMAKGAPTAAQMADLQKLGVHFVACENAMRAHNITKADLLPGVTSVPSGIVELVRKQEAGYSYVKVGK